MGTAHALVNREWLTVLETRPDLITILRVIDFGDELLLCYVKSPILLDDEIGTQVIVCVNVNPLEIKFDRDLEV